ncbi:ankyrin repeat, PH and SEC7 domain containing protein secG-like [Haliotis rubra]|uniref:ankyrin repeat, PH and SEC7 domain containing protein secG-like n=1 Tax=Haliotis rubra TaxID=36100 RepID=UPI001EE6334B|nr:ankyrin repeat, PH and SEC7 domain containing protein secG-like [Haliotis rubra]
MEIITVTFFSVVLLCGVKDVSAWARRTNLAKRVRQLEKEVNVWKFTTLNTEIKMMIDFKKLESSLKEELAGTFVPSLIKRLVKQEISDILKEGDIGDIISGHVLDEVGSLKASVQSTKTQLKTITQQLKHVERERDSYRKSLEKLRGRLTKDIRALQMQLNQTNDDFFAKKQITGLTEVSFSTSTTTYPATTTASTDPSKTVPSTPVTTQDSDLHASTYPSQDPIQGKTVPPAPVTTQEPDPHATPSQADRDLYSACTDGDLGTVRWILAAGHVDINTRGGWRRRTAVMEAARWGHKEVVELLVGKGADVSLLDKYRRNILHYACWSGDVETVKLILSLNEVDINSRGWRSKTPVMAAAGEGKGDVLAFLVGRGADVSLVDVDGSNILLYACMGGDMKAVKLILSLNVVDINATNNYGHTAAYMARREGHQQVVDLLASRGAH